MTESAYEIVDKSTTDELLLALLVEGQQVAQARAESGVVDQMWEHLGVSREDVKRELRSALEQLHLRELEKVTIDRLREQPEGSLKFWASFLFRDFKNVTEGLVWYDVSRSETGPADVSPLVRNKLRYAVHARLTGDNSKAEELRKVIR